MEEMQKQDQRKYIKKDLQQEAKLHEIALFLYIQIQV